MTEARARFLIPLFVVLTLTPFVVLAADAPPPGFIRNNPEFASWGFGIMFSAVVALLGLKIKADSRKHRDDHENNTRQWRAINNHEMRLSTLEGAHSVNHPPVFRRYEDE